jgi:hypothetical protein
MIKTRWPLLILSAAATITIIYFLSSRFLQQKQSGKTAFINKDDPARYTVYRAQYMYDLIKDPVTGKIPRAYLDEELPFAKKIPQKGSDAGMANRPDALNTYFPAGPNNQGGRVRAVAYDLRYNGTTNRIIIAGGVSGGIMRSADGGQTWARVSPDEHIHNVSSIAQDPRPGNQDIWYAGGGEPVGNSASELGAAFLGFGIYKSTDNGVTWSRLPLNTITDINGTTILGAGTLEVFDHPFDFVHKILVSPVNGEVYIASHRRLVRSTDGGNTFRVVFGSAVPANSGNGQMDIAIANTGKILLAVNGGNPDGTLRGVWTSTSGNVGSWTRIAGGSILGVDSVAGWRANSPSNTSKRILVTMAPSNQNIAYVCYENGLLNVSPDNAPEADLFKLDMTSGNVWTNLSANMPDFPGSHAATDPFAIQGGYDLFITVKPDDPNFVLLGGTSLYRSTNGFASTANTSWIGGYGNTLPTLTFYPGSHPDIHNLVFNPVNPNEAICANDGGIQVTTNITAPGSTVTWTHLDNFQTLQYYNVAIDPETGRNNFVGGAQDNGTQFRDKTGVTGLPAADSNNHRRVLSGDGCYSGFSKLSGSTQFVYASIQLGSIRRAVLQNGLNSGHFTTITPSGLTAFPGGGSSEFGEFVTNFRLNPDNTDDLYYVNFNRLFRTTSATTVTSSAWTELTGVRSSVNPGNPTGGTNIAIRALGFSRGPYTTSHTLYIGTTNGKIFRLDNPRNAVATAVPVDITPATLPAGANVQDIAVNPNNDDEIMAVVTNYLVGGSPVINIWWTNNAKAAAPTWRNAEGNLTLPSIRSCMIVVKKDAANNPVTEYYVGTSVGLYSAADIGPILTGGGSVTWQREGGSVLNFAVVQSLAYRPSDNVLLVGTHGNGLYYTFLGTPNFNPNQNTGTNDPTLNDKNFIRQVMPTVTSGEVFYKTGSLLDVNSITVQIYNMNGQVLYRSDRSFQDGSVSLSAFSRGVYMLSIYSNNRKYRHLQKIIKQ